MQKAILFLSYLPHRWRTVVFLSFFTLLIYAFLYLKQNTDQVDFLDNQTSDEVDLSFLYEKRLQEPVLITKPIHGIENFESSLPRIQAHFEPETIDQTRKRMLRQEAVKQSFMHGWSGYKKYALGNDELKPLSNKSYNPFGGMGATMVDSLGTMIIMGLDDEVEELLPLIDKIEVMVNEPLSVFETIIRYMGGLLSAYELYEGPGREVLLNKAAEIGYTLLPAFDTPYGIPHYRFNPVRSYSSSRSTFLADAASVQLEFFALSLHTGNPVFAERAQAITDFLKRSNVTQGTALSGLYPNVIDVQNGIFKRSQISFGAMGDSAYEYFLKEHIYVDGRTSMYSTLYKEAIDSMKSNMLAQVPGKALLFLPPFEVRANRRAYSMDHLTCFVPGMLAMGSKVLNRPEDLSIAKGLLDTCIHMYRSTATNLSPEVWAFDEVVGYDPLTYGKSEDEVWGSSTWLSWLRVQRPNLKAKTWNGTLNKPIDLPKDFVKHIDVQYLLRPETVESLFMLYRITGDPIYQEYGWEIYQAIEKHCRTPTAYASLKDVSSRRPVSPLNQIDSMETFLFAETFKYLYLLFSPPDVISLDKFVFNTEAHPLLRRSFSQEKH
ncbi:glycoside hydrolase [Choanephora cucurbitarum]|nr:glycoside hydrolase [Choanephora cucurbitarum]